MVPALLVYVSLALPRAGLTPSSYGTAIAEVAAIWAAHDVVVRAASPAVPPADDEVVVRVVVQPRPRLLESRWSGALASVRFDGSGAPLPEIALYLPNLIDMIERSNIPGSGGDPWPTILRERAIGRAVGRVLAHELGHYLLRSRTHARFGLMRAIQNAADLVGAGRETFALSPAEAARWAVIASDTPVALDGDCAGGDR